MRNQSLQFTITCLSMKRILLLTCALFLFVDAIAQAETTKRSEPPAGQTVFPPKQKEAARESLKIQQQLGGSLVHKYNLLQSIPDRQHLLVPSDHAPAQLAPGNHPSVNHPNSRSSPVELLRETASGLDRAANRLEESNLYPQADALREMAQKLRLEARTRQASKSATVITPKQGV
jgi:hypothetical protein